MSFIFYFLRVYMAIRKRHTDESFYHPTLTADATPHTPAKKPSLSTIKKIPNKSLMLSFVLGGVVSGVALGILDHHGVFNPSFKIDETFLSENGASVVASDSKNGLQAYIIQSDGNADDRIAVFTTRSGDIIMGNVLDKKGDPIFSSFIQEHIGSQSAGAEQVGTEQIGESGYGQMLGRYEGELPEVIKFVDSLQGFKEDPSVSAADTLYVVYDPRCPYCHKFFEMSRDLNLKAKGLTIKWLPTLALGAARNGTNDEALAVAGMTLNPKKDAKAFADTFDGVAPKIDVNESHRTALLENTQLLLDAAESQGLSAAVPTAFYLDKKTGKPRIVVSPGDAENLKMIFGE